MTPLATAARAKLARASCGAFVVVLCSAGASCEPIEPRPSTTAPINSCADFPCEHYELDRPNVKLQCPAPVGRCVFPNQRPEGKFFLVVHSPDTASYGAGLTFVIPGEELDPTTNADPTIAKAPCRGTPLAPICVSLPNLTAMTSYYRVLAKAATDVGFPLALTGETSIPVRVVYDQVGTAEPQIVDVEPLPLDVFFALPRRVGDEIQNVRALPYGRFRREVYPLPPWDGWFPPNAKTFDVKTPNFLDDFRLGSIHQQLDDISGTSRTAVVTRAEGLASGSTIEARGDASRRCARFPKAIPSPCGSIRRASGSRRTRTRSSRRPKARSDSRVSSRTFLVVPVSRTSLIRSFRRPLPSAAR
jgi:hypothetical protein